MQLATTKQPSKGLRPPTGVQARQIIVDYVPPNVWAICTPHQRRAKFHIAVKILKEIQRLQDNPPVTPWPQARIRLRDLSLEVPVGFVTKPNTAGLSTGAVRYLCLCAVDTMRLFEELDGNQPVRVRTRSRGRSTSSTRSISSSKTSSSKSKSRRPKANNRGGELPSPLLP